MLVWITGLSGSGKSTLGNAVYHSIKPLHVNTVFLDGDNFRNILGNDLGHNYEDRLENAKRIHRMCKFLTSQNINVVCATMSLYEEIHIMNRAQIGNYYEVFIYCDMDELIKRDQKGLYSLAKKDPRCKVVGVNSAYDIPEHCELTIDNSKKGQLEEKTQKILQLIGMAK